MPGFEYAHREPGSNWSGWRADAKAVSARVRFRLVYTSETPGGYGAIPPVWVSRSRSLTGRPGLMAASLPGSAGDCAGATAGMRSSGANSRARRVSMGGSVLASPGRQPGEGTPQRYAVAGRASTGQRVRGESVQVHVVARRGC